MTDVTDVAAAVLQRPDGKVLLLKRSPDHTTNAGKWCFVTGYVEAGEAPHDAARRELAEELGIMAEPVKAGEVVVVDTDWGATLHVYPYLFEFQAQPIRLDEEHVDYRWIDPEAIYEYDTVQQLDEDLIHLGLL